MHAPAHFGMSSIQNDSPDGWIIFGSHSNISDQLAWHQQLSHFIQSQLEKNIPTLGICFGHQLIAHHFGAEISRIDNMYEIHQGKRLTKIINNFHGFKKGQNYSIFTSHKYEVSNLSKHLIHVGESDLCKYDIVSHESLPYLGVQGHPESSEYFIHKEVSKPINPKDLKDIIKGGDYFMEEIFKNFLV
jgi:GMP synthase-like glutamine amidotransferase